MEAPKTLGVLLSVLLLIHIALSAKQPVVAQKSKLCGNEKCDEILFKARVKRVMGVNGDPNFLNLVENGIISVVAVKFSDRPDIMEGKLNDADPPGFFYAGAIDILPFAEFLRTAIDEKKEMLMISQNPSDVGDKRIVGFVHSETDLVRDYNAKNAQAAAENGLPMPTPLPIPEPPNNGHGHSHGGHGHSHGGHGHSHGHPAPTPSIPEAETPKIPEAAPEAPKEAPKVAETAPEIPAEAAPKLGLNNVLGTPPIEKLDPKFMDEEIERLINQETELLKEKAKIETEDVTQPLLVLSSLPATPEVVPEDPKPSEDVRKVPEVVSAPEAVPEAVTLPPLAQEVPEVVTAAPEAVSAPEVVPEAVTLPPLTQEAPEVVTFAPEAVTPPFEAPPTPEAPEIVTTTSSPPVIPEEPIIPNPEVQTPPEVTEELKTPPTFDAPPTTTTTPPPISAEEEEFLKFEEERRQKREAEAHSPYEDAQGHQFQAPPLPPTPPTSAGLIETIRGTIGLGNVSDANVLLYLNLTFVLASILVYFIVRIVSGGGNDSDVLDRQAYFELVTKHKQLQLQLQAKCAEIQKLEQTPVQQSQQPNHEPELTDLRQQVSRLHNDLQTVQSERDELRFHFSQISESSNQKDQQIAELDALRIDQHERLELKTTEAAEWTRYSEGLKSELDELKNQGFDRQNELETEIRTLRAKIEEIQVSGSQDLKNAEKEIEKMKNQLESLKNLNESLEKELEEAKIPKSNESGGSGWSDFGDEDVEVEKRNSEETETIKKLEKEAAENLEKIKKLELKLKELKDADKSKENNRETIEMEIKLKTTEENLVEAKKKLEETENRNTEMFKMAMTKTSETDQQIAVLRSEIYEKDKKLLDLESSLKAKDDEIRKMDADFKLLQRESNKLQTKSYYDSLKMKQELDELRANQFLNAPPGLPRMESKSPHNLWETPDQFDQKLVGPPAPPPPGAEDYFSSGSISSKRRSSRRSALPNFDGSDLDHSKTSSSSKKEGVVHRRRSRSQGRQVPSFHDQYPSFSMYNNPASGSDSSFISQNYGYSTSTGRINKSGIGRSGGGHYSSGGSNGARSPSPEMPILSARPPSGARKPIGRMPDSHLGK